jgi:hypothetical protein
MVRARTTIMARSSAIELPFCARGRNGRRTAAGLYPRRGVWGSRVTLALGTSAPPEKGAEMSVLDLIPDANPARVLVLEQIAKH